MEETYVYALDLSLNSTGVCVFTNDGKIVEIMTIDTHKEKETKFKLKLIGNDLTKLMKVYKPEVVVIEQGFTRFNASTQSIFRVHGLVNYLFCEYKQVYYPATTVKKTVGGKGNITKEELQEVILSKNKKLKFENYDESDAYAVGLTYFSNHEVKESTCQEKLSQNGLHPTN